MMFLEVNRQHDSSPGRNYKLNCKKRRYNVFRSKDTTNKVTPTVLGFEAIKRLQYMF